MNEQRRHSQRGFTLIEILTAVAVFAVVMIAALLIYDRSNKVFKQGVEASNLQQNTRVAFDKVVADMRMAGFDFDRDGIPTVSVGGSNLYQQPDEQFEYVGPHAVTIRANFDYESESAPCTGGVTTNCDHGREGTTYESTQFPLVTTGNDEIVTYALVPASQEGSSTYPTCNPLTNCVQFYADIRTPRRSYPDPGAGGLDENLVQIPGVDLCSGGCSSPPYTLYRFTIQNDGTINRTPLASNIRSLSFSYFQDAQGIEPLKDLNNTAAVDVSTVRGQGQYLVANSGALVVERELRSKINSIHVELIGMNEVIDRSYVATNSAGVTDTAAPNNRQYRLDTLVSPRNILRRGMREQDVFPPGPPTLNSACTGPCGGVYLKWTAPAVAAGFGAAEQYKIIYGPSATTGFPCETTTFTQTETHLFGTGVACTLTPNVQYKFAVVALNGYGSNVSNELTATPLNGTKPAAPTILSASTNLNSQITLTWSRPQTNASGSVSCGPTYMPAAELMGYKIERAASATQPAAASSAWQMIGGPDTTMSSYSDTVTWTDTTAANCTIYWYRITTVEKCSLVGAYNVGGSTALGLSDPSVAASGTAVSAIPPQTPADLQVEQATYSCVGTNCSAHMSWPRVTLDTSSNPINIMEYKIYRRLVGSTTWALDGTQTTIPATGAVAYASSLLDISGGKQYEFTVTANQCNTLESARFSPPRTRPCSFPSGVVGATMLSASGAADGDGSSGAPWLFFNASDSVTVHVNVTDATQLQSVVAQVYTAAGTLKTSLIATAATGWNFSWIVGNNTTERIVVTATSTSGCTKIESAYVGDMPQNCCLIPRSADGTVVTFTSGTSDVDIILKNVCGEALTLFSNFRITWTTGSGQKIDSVTFIPPSGSSTVTTFGSSGENSSPVNVTVPTGTVNVPAGSTTYKVRIHFRNNSASNPVTGITVTYQRSGVDSTNQSCPVVP
jgi:prepilin-type N-terminal cleavage/methylation domain-containing protein